MTFVLLFCALGCEWVVSSTLTKQSVARVENRKRLSKQEAGLRNEHPNTAKTYYISGLLDSTFT